MPEFQIADNQTGVLANLLKELTARDTLKWKEVDTNCYISRIGTQEFSVCQWPEGLEVNFSGLKFRGYGFGLSDLRNAVDEQRNRMEQARERQKHMVNFYFLTQR